MKLHVRPFAALPFAAALFLLAVAFVGAQDRLRTMPGVEQYTRMQPLTQGAVVSGAVTATWAGDSRSFTYATGGKAFRFDVATLMPAETGEAPAGGAGARGAGARGAGGRAGGQGAPPPAGQQAQTPPPAGQATPPAGQTPPAGRGRQATPPVPGQTPPAAGRSGGMQQAQSEMTAGPISGCPSGAAARGRQADCVVSPDQKLKAFYRDRNLWVANFDGSNERAVTKEGNEKGRLKFGTGSWVYGEELSQTTAIWWSPDSKKVGYYRFDESQVKDYFLQMNQTAVQDTLDVEAYPKPGQPNPIADVFVYDLAGATSTHIDARDGQPFTNDVVGHYAYNVRWSPDGSELFLNRTNRRQQIMEFTACSPSTGKCRVVVREEWLTGWVDNRPQLRYLADNKRFIWESERNGFNNYYLYDLTGKLINPITTNATAESGAIVKLDEAAGVMFYMARDGDNYMKQQLHRVGLDGKGDVRLTDPKFTHTVAACGGGGGGRGRGAGGPFDAGAQVQSVPGPAGVACGISPDNRLFVDVYQTHDQPAASQLVDASSGKVLAQLGKSDLTKFNEAGFKKAEQYTYKAADGKTTLYGQIQFPSNFDPSKKYPTLIAVYGGPASGSNVPTESFAGPAAMAEYGFLVVGLSSRAAPGMGKRMLDSIYLKLGITEMDDMAEGIKALWTRPYFDKGRVGMYGTSYGGYTSATMILRHPEAVTAASAGSPVTSWYNYDSIYTERYMWIPQENKEGYEGGSDMNFAKDLRGRLLLYYGTADNNVHPNNSMQLVQALQRAGKNFEMQVGPDQGHSGVNQQRMMEFFIENLVMHPERLVTPGGV
jgi:dipeptidyl-peptidase-4